MAAAASNGAFGLAARSNMLLPGLLAWVATVGGPAAERGVGTLPRATAGIALSAIVVGPILASSRPRLGRVIGIHATVLASLATWLLASASIGVQHLEPVRAAIGVVAWILFAFGWGAVRAPGHVPEDDPRAILGPPLPARSQLPLGSSAIFGVGLFSAGLPLVAAWRVSRPSHALFAHAVAIVAAIGLVTASARIATERQSYKPLTPASARLASAVRPLTLLAVVVIARLIWALLR